MREQNKGFTFVEILVGAAVIAILATVVYGSLIGVREKSRDAQRVNDLEQIKLALRIYKDTTGGYPDCEDGFILGENNPLDPAGVCNEFVDPLIAPSNIPEVPHDPLGPGDATYRYIYDSNYDCPLAGNGLKVIYAESVERPGSTNWDQVCDSLATNSYGFILK